MKLCNAMPHEFMGVEYEKCPARKYADVEVVVEHLDGGWPGEQRHVMYWVELSNGYCVGWNENPSTGWSFPITAVYRKRGHPVRGW